MIMVMKSKPPVSPVSEEPVSQNSTGVDFLNRPEFQPLADPRRLRRPLYLYVLPLLLLVLVGAGLAVYRFHVGRASVITTTNQQSTTAHPAQPTTIQPDVTWKTYSDDFAGLTFRYPSSWSSQVADTIRYGDGSFGGVSGTLVSPSGHKLTWVYDVIGGKDGPQCTPAPGDTPFSPTNKCATKQILSVTQVPIATAYARQTAARSLFEDSLYITETKLGSGKNLSYYICLDPYYKSSTTDPGLGPPIVGASMGVEFPCAYYATGFNVTFPVDSQASFNSVDAQTAIAIMKTFSSYSAHSAADAVIVAQSAFEVALDHTRSTSNCWTVCKVNQADIDNVRDFINDTLYQQLSSNLAQGRDGLLCSQQWPSNVTGSLQGNSGSTATVVVNNIVATVDLPTLLVTNIRCP